MISCVITEMHGREDCQKVFAATGRKIEHLVVFKGQRSTSKNRVCDVWGAALYGQQEPPFQPNNKSPQLIVT